MKIVVLAGGNSTEREVSIVSGSGICRALRSKGHQAVLADPFCGQETVDWEDPFPKEYDVEQATEYIRSFNGKIEEMKKTRKEFFGENILELCKAADFVFLGLHGANGEDGRIQAVFDLMGIRYSGSDHLSSAMAMDKGITKQIFLMNGIPTPRGLTMNKKKYIRNPEEIGMDFPVVVKTCNGGSSIGVYIAGNQKEYDKALEEAFRYEDKILLEEYIKGTEYTAAVVDGEAYPVVEIVPVKGFYDYENKYQPGATKETCPAPISRELTRKIQEYSVMAYHALGLKAYARFDFIMTEEEELFCLEGNTLPGMTPTSLIPQEAQVLGMDYATLCEKLMDVSLK